MISIKKQALVGICTAILAILSQISIPLPVGVPLTFQIFGVVLIAIVLKEKLAVMTIIIYILLGCIGIPVFANFSSGLQCLIGPSGGFLTGFIIMAFIIGLASRKKKGPLLWISSFLGLLIDYSIGIMQLIMVTQLSLKEAFIAGVYPFVLKDIVCVIVAMYITNYIQHVERSVKI